MATANMFPSGVLVVGAGTMGRQIALQCAVHGLEVCLYDVSAEQLDRAARWIDAQLGEFVGTGWLGAAEAGQAVRRIRPVADAAAAADGAELLSESVPERLSVKRHVFRQFHALCGPRTLFVTNSSYYLPSMMAAGTGRPDRFAALHFHSPVWLANVVDIAPHPRTAPETIEQLAGFARRIGQIPIVLRKESPGYVFNAMLWAFLVEALRLVGNEVASVEDVDRAWMGVLGTRIGPFGILDRIGLDTAHEIMTQWGPLLGKNRAERPAAVLANLVRDGRLGEKAGQGFYSYPGPAWAAPGFLAGVAAAASGSPAASRWPPLFGPAAENACPAPRSASAAPAGAGCSADSAAHPSLPPGLVRLATHASRVEGTAAEEVCRRYVLRLVAAPVDHRLRHAPRFFGRAWVLGGNPSAAALRQRLERLGIPALAVGGGDVPSCMAWIDAAWSEAPAPHLFVLSARDEPGSTHLDAAYGCARYERGLLLPYFVVQQWYARVCAAGLADQATLVAATALGGDFGLSPKAMAADGGGIAGLLKAVFMEAAAQGALGPQTVVVDFPADHPSSEVADTLLGEMALAQAAVLRGGEEELVRRHAEIEVAYVGGRRHVLRLVESPLDAGVPESLPGGPWLLTGGARGITALVAKQLGSRFHVPLHLVGTTPLPAVDYSSLGAQALAELKARVMHEAYARHEKPNVAWQRVEKQIEVQRNLTALAQSGVDATYHVCDVQDREGLGRVLARIREVHGPLVGVVHGAGVEVTGRLEKKTPDLVASTVGVKYLGTLALVELTRADPLRYFLVFGSLSGRFGGVGQTDYAMANDAMAKVISCLRAERPECISVVFDWPAWAEVGMSVRPTSQSSLRRVGHRFMSSAEGCRHFLRELAGGGSAGEVLFVAPRELPSAHLCPSLDGERKEN